VPPSPVVLTWYWTCVVTAHVPQVIVSPHGVCCAVVGPTLPSTISSKSADRMATEAPEDCR
jgi:hypothetical protein